ncbi:MAG: hypothetical protein ACYTDU_06855 [Planctomycetota bacterium]|jgi:hypothetical protein
MGLIPYRNGYALAAYYVGLLPIFLLGAAAVFLGLRGLALAREHPDVEGKIHAWVGIIRGGVFGLVWLVVTTAVIAS